MCMVGVIPQRFQLQAEQGLVSLGSCHMWEDCTKSCARRSECICNQSGVSYPFPIQLFCQPHTPQLLFVWDGNEVGGLLVIILQF
jgi:hypothetical protein